MTSPEIKTEPISHNESSQICRLCMSEESLECVFKDEQLKEWIWELLAIKISGDDRMSQVICTVCRVRLAEFHQFRMGCHEVQEVLQELIPDETDEAQSLTVATQSGESSTHCQEGGMENDLLDIKDCIIEALVEEKESDESSHKSSGGDKTSDKSDNAVASNDNKRKEADSNQLYQCDLCPKVFFNSTKLTRHKRYHRQKLLKQTAPDEANEANTEKKDSKKTKTKAYVDESNKDQVLQCAVCQKICQTKKILRMHKLIEHGPKNHRCDICDVQYTFRCDMTRHVYTKKHLNKVREKQILEVEESSNDDRANGGKNNKHIKDSNSLKDDMFSKYQLNKKFDGKCNECDKIFSNRWDLANHMQYHKPKKYVCHVCGKPGRNINSLEKHLLTHVPIVERQKARPPRDIKHAPKPFKCDICKSGFTTKNTLWYHKKTIHGPKKFECEICGYRFAETDFLMKHLQKHASSGHTKEDFRALKKLSQQNDKSTNQHNDESDHSSVPTENEANDNDKALVGPATDKTFQCNVCQKAFETTVLLYRHNKLVHKSKKYKCSICGKRYAFRSQLKMHLQIHKPNSLESTVAKDFECPECHKIYASWRGLYAHVRDHHVRNKIISGQTFACEKCDKKFHTEQRLGGHMRIVHAPVEHKCDICKITFPIHVRLWHHMKKQHGKTTPNPASEDTTEESDLEDSVQISNKPKRKQPQRSAKVKEAKLSKTSDH